MLRFFEYFRGIRFKDKSLHIASTGAVIELDKSFWNGAAAVLKIYVHFAVRKTKQIFARPSMNGTIAFYPQTPGPWYNIWQVVRLAGLKVQSDISTADYAFVFEDKTYSEYDKNFAKDTGVIQLNHRVDDISKEHVADIFEDVFGYALRIDPTTYKGLAIRKSNDNGTHDGVVVEFPIEASDVSESDCYQRLVDSTFNEGMSEDLRVAYVLGEIALVYHKYKPLDDRFGTYYLSVEIKAPEDVFTKEEIELIVTFCGKMGLDFGAVDVMRDKHDGKIYIVDVNKTCMPVLCLNLKTQIKAQQRMADALIEGLSKRGP